MERQITVTGWGQETSPPDTAFIDLRLWAESDTVEEATTTMGSALGRVTEALDEAGVTSAHTSRMNARTAHDPKGIK